MNTFYFKVIWKEIKTFLFNDVINTFYLLLCGVEHMVKDHSGSEKGKALPQLYGLFFSIISKGSFICTIPDRIAHTMAFVWKEGKKCLFNDAPKTHFIQLYGVRHNGMCPIRIAREQTRCRHHMGYFSRITARNLLYAPSHRQYSTYHGRWNTGWNKNRSMCSP